MLSFIVHRYTWHLCLQNLRTHTQAHTLTLFTHACMQVGNILGDVGSYDYFSLGGPYSVRGYNYGEIGAARRFAELSAEVRGRGGRGGGVWCA